MSTQEHLISIFSKKKKKKQEKLNTEVSKQYYRLVPVNQY